MRKGFTLVELLVVISIMSILTVITVAQFTSARKKARDVQRKAELSSLSKALGMYYADYGKYPTTIYDEFGLVMGIAWGGEFKDATGYVYMKQMPTEPSPASYPQYCYVVDDLNNPRKFGLFAKLENAADSECGGPYLHCGGKSYCYYIVSPNAAVGDFTEINP